MRINIPITPDARLLVALALLAVLGLLVGVGATGSAVWNAAAALTFILVMADFFCRLASTCSNRQAGDPDVLVARRLEPGKARD